MGGLKSQKGSLSLGSLIFLLIAGIGIYVGLMLAFPWVRFYQVEQLFKDQAIRLKVAPEEEVSANINQKLKELNVTISDEEGIRIIRAEGKSPAIEATYREDVQFIGGYIYTYVFKPRGEAPKSGGYN